ncbi:hypothetical protein E1286_05175 [Nonomuraea terrae]|uniref:Uncharacterized protein n=1 Tax=Nonomuraea terrae TaxID=2530383 RepID=A0A4R4Z8P7_9ACTN|nr:hypothetical protein [Nonomuraea terrae]TDD54583.1 hypothetical protein E1286_05175 [Nonomuraea terrae]
MARLTTTVYVVDPDGRQRPFGPGVDLPEWAVTQISNPDVWDGDLPEHLNASDEKDEDQGPDNGQQPEPELQEPPRGGSGSGKEAWAAYAAARGVEVDADASRDDIIDLLAERGLID